MRPIGEDYFVNDFGSHVLGRLFTFDEALHFVLEVTEDAFCRVSRRIDGRQDIIVMPLGEVLLRVKGIV